MTDDQFKTVRINLSDGEYVIPARSLRLLTGTTAFSAYFDPATRPDNQTEMTVTDEQPLFVQVGWWCWRCEGVTRTACRSDAVPVYVPAEDAEDVMAALPDD